ncbi:hypothetical protein [Epilithonimonas sp.]|uniref:hypothetical protein n=1 Tax=Epilithonimonas sp. TaxID=2894511 RepID=UPI0035B4010D
MIRKVRYQDIDFEKYNDCIENSAQKNFYCKRENLDFLCKNWELLVYGDYEAVMPIPFFKKFGIKFVDMPLFCQQLGIFSKINDNSINQKLVDYFRKKYSIINYQFNYCNTIADIQEKKNYIIAIQEYAFLRRKKYFKGRKSTVKTAQYLEFREIFINSHILDFINKNLKGLEKESDLDFFIKYLFFLEKNEKLKMYGSYFQDNLTNLAILTDDSGSYSLLGLINNEDMKEHNGASFLIDRILHDHIENKAFNFMGGSIRGIEVFFKSFGAELQEYPVIQNSKKDIIRNWLKIS